MMHHTLVKRVPEILGQPCDQVKFETEQGLHFEGTLLSLCPYSASFELCGPDLALRSSQVLESFEIHGSTRSLYRGKATLKSLTPLGGITACEALLEGNYNSIDFDCLGKPREFAQLGFHSFLAYWSKFCRIQPEYKCAVADLQCFLHDLKVWLDEVELGLSAMPNGERLSAENTLAREFAASAGPSLASLYEHLELAAANIEEELLPAHFAYCRRELHPFLLVSPFMYRIFSKPLGYAGDYEMVNMILRNKPEGASLFAKLLNLFILSQTPAVAHRNRVYYLTERLMSESSRRVNSGLPCRVFNIGCGPAGEVQEFLTISELSRMTQFTLLDANQETLDYAAKRLSEVAQQHGRPAQIRLVKNSVQQMLKQSNRPKGENEEYDFIYSAGLFDYLSGRVCRLLVEQCYSLLAPGGLLLVTNVDRSNPIRNIMEHLYDWYLIYRDGNQLANLAAGLPGDPDVRVQAESTSSNLILEVRKPSQSW